MPYKCVVPFCNSNYDSGGKKFSVFSFPKNENLLNKWKAAIPRDNLIVNKNSRVSNLSLFLLLYKNIYSVTIYMFCYYVYVLLLYMYYIYFGDAAFM
jgi:hypothetical protein